ncbi:MAG: hypothetical protein HPY52_13830 [Firmicutes bacterium]|nr:hypothetical protein [Bacillota bacterium]
MGSLFILLIAVNATAITLVVSARLAMIGGDYLKLSDLCKERRIETIKVKTPLLVPSFSSRGFPEISKIHGVLSEYTPDTSLISAYDIRYGHLDAEKIYCSEILFVDSGGFEVGTNQDLSDFYGVTNQSKEWSEDRYLETILSLKPLSSLVIISYDTRAALSDQIGKAQRFFSKIPRDYARDFLIKPLTEDSGSIDVKSIVECCEELGEFDVVGVVEKELGSSFLERCRSLVKIRKAFYEQSIDIPIHVLGCLDPLSVLVYFLCGADIFDGLSWLRLAYNEGTAVYYNSYALTEGLWTQGYTAIHAAASIRNIQQLARTQALMGRFARSHDWGVLELKLDHQKQIQALIGSANVEFQEVV